MKYETPRYGDVLKSGEYTLMVIGEGDGTSYPSFSAIVLEARLAKPGWPGFEEGEISTTWAKAHADWKLLDAVGR